MKSYFKPTRHLNVVVVVLIVSILVYIFLLRGAYIRGDLVTFYVIGIPILAMILNVVYLHLEYLVVNWNFSLVIDSENRSLHLYQRESEKIISFNDVKIIEHHKPVALASKGRKILLTDTYEYSKILLKDGSKFYITSLVYPDFTLGLGEQEKIVTRVVASIVVERARKS